MSRSGVDESCLMVLIKIQLNALSLLNEMSVKFMKKTKKRNCEDEKSSALKMRSSDRGSCHCWKETKKNKSASFVTPVSFFQKF